MGIGQERHLTLLDMELASQSPQSLQDTTEHTHTLRMQFFQTFAALALLASLAKAQTPTPSATQPIGISSALDPTCPSASRSPPSRRLAPATLFLPSPAARRNAVRDVLLVPLLRGCRAPLVLDRARRRLWEGVEMGRLRLRRRAQWLLLPERRRRGMLGGEE